LSDTIHEALFEYLDEYAEGQLPPEDAARVEAHLADCAECRRWLEMLRAQKATFDPKNDPEPVPDLAAWVAAQDWIREADALPVAAFAKGNGKALRMNRAASVAAALILVVGLGAIGVLSLHPFSASKAAPMAPMAMDSAAATETTDTTAEAPMLSALYAEDAPEDPEMKYALRTLADDEAAEDTEEEPPAAGMALTEEEPAPQSKEEEPAILNSVLTTDGGTPRDMTAGAGEDEPAEDLPAASDALSVETTTDAEPSASDALTEEAPAVLGAKRDAPPRRSGLWLAVLVAVIGVATLVVWRVRKAREEAGQGK